MKIIKLGVFRPKLKLQQQQVQSQRDVVLPGGRVDVVAEGVEAKSEEGEVKVDEGEVKVDEGEVKVEEKGEVKTDGTVVQVDEEEPKTDGEPKPEGETQRKPKRKALLIGIQNYDNDTAKRLRGPHQDVLDMRQLLIGELSLFPLLHLATRLTSV